MEIRSVVPVVIVMQIPININSLSINKLTDQPKLGLSENSDDIVR